MLSFGVYYRSLLAYLVVAALVGGSFYLIRNLRAVADIASFNQATSTINYNRTVEITTRGKANLIDPSTSAAKALRRSVAPHDTGTRFWFKIFDQPGQEIGNVQVKVKLPATTTVAQVDPRGWLIHSTDTEVNVKSDSANNTIIFSGQDVGPAAIFTVQIDFPAGAISLPLWEQLWGKLIGYSTWFWIILAVGLPAITFLSLVILLRIYLLRHRPTVPTQPIVVPPEKIPPALAGVLYHSQVGPRDIAATLIDLAVRNQLNIVNKNGQFSIAQVSGQAMSDLAEFEKILLSKIFYQDQSRATLADIQFRIGHRLFSDKIAYVYLNLYQLASQRGWFDKNPILRHRRWRNWSLLLFAVGLIGFLAGLIFAPDPKGLLFFWVGMMGAALLLNGLVGAIPARSSQGTKDLGTWLGFRNYLTSPEPVGYTEANQNLFSLYLPYAIALDCELEWTARFRDHPFSLPEWYYSHTNTLEDFDRELFPLIEWLGASLAANRVPGVD